jgi:hypothetical protein
MKVFHRVEPWTGKVNFIDEDDAVIGYDLEQCCCEDADWFIHREPDVATIPEEAFNSASNGLDELLRDYRIDKDWFQQIADDYGGGIAIFRLFDVKGEKSDLFLHLTNSHNGYYSHGFSLEVGGTTIREDSI